MRSKYSTIVYILFVLIFLGGLSLLFLRQPFIDYFREETGVTDVEVITVKPLSEDKLMNTDILETDEFSSLTNQVTVFSWEDICGDSINSPRPCSVGNSNPFIRK